MEPGKRQWETNKTVVVVVVVVMVIRPECCHLLISWVATAEELQQALLVLMQNLVAEIDLLEESIDSRSGSAEKERDLLVDSRSRLEHL